jgi:hypothetical protein
MKLNENCDHRWSKIPMGSSNKPSIYKCDKCKEEMYVSEIFQYEALKNQTISVENQTKLAKHQLGFQKWLAISAFIISFTALIISTIK